MFQAKDLFQWLVISEKCFANSRIMMHIYDKNKIINKIFNFEYFHYKNHKKRRDWSNCKLKQKYCELIKNCQIKKKELTGKINIS